MKHLGDITLIKGNEAPVVDVIIGGSPCQDLSVAGKRAGLAGERSGLFMEQIRIIKEMREADVLRGRTDDDVRPRYGIWENVPGALSSPGKGHAGEDFAAVLEEFIRVAEPEAPTISVPEKGWPTAGCFWDELGRWSVAWRILDSQFWGVPQRRRRICLCADFNGLNAPKIVFGEVEHNGSTKQSGGESPFRNSGAKPRSSLQPVTQSVSGNLEPGEQKRKEAPGDAGEGSGGAVPFTLKIRGGCSGGGKGALIQEDKSATLSTLQDQTLFQPVFGIDQQGGKGGANYSVDVMPPMMSDSHGTPHAVCYSIGSYHSEGFKSNNPHSGIYAADTSRTLDALNCGYPGCNQGGMAVVQPVTYQRVTGPLMANSHPGSYTGQDAFSDMLVAGPVADVEHRDELILFEPRSQDGVPRIHGDISPTLNTAQGGQRQPCVSLLQSDAAHNLNSNNVVRVKHIVRRLTPLECERLQGFPDGWTDIGEWVDSKGKKHKEADSPRYKALGNSIAIPPWKWVLKRLCACYERDATMASLFDGIGGFPYIWEQLNGKGSCLWASEIEEFPMAVTKVRFGE